MSHPDLRAPDVWKQLFPSALKLMAHLEAETEAPAWTFGGGTVLMLRIRHRESRDIDLSFPILSTSATSTRGSATWQKACPTATKRTPSSSSCTCRTEKSTSSSVHR